jgi:hypothetical protein
MDSRDEAFLRGLLTTEIAARMSHPHDDSSLRAAIDRWTQALADEVRGDLNEAAARLRPGGGRRRAGPIDPDLLIDCCAYSLRLQGETGIERLRRKRPAPRPGSAADAVIEAAFASRLALVFVEDVDFGVGIDTYDVVRDESFFVFDGPVSLRARPGYVFLTRVYSVDELTLSSGLMVLMWKCQPEDRDSFSAWFRATYLGLNFDGLTRHEVEAMEIRLLREMIAVVDRDRQAVPDLASDLDDEALFDEPFACERSELRRTGPNVGRNDPCPCGSGKKYKRCCGGV